MLQLPFWRTHSGLTPDKDQLPPSERNIHLKRLYEMVLTQLRAFIASEGTDPESEKLRTPLWTPLHYICQRFEISHSHLSRLLRELTGLSAVQTWDKLRIVENGIPKQYIQLLQEFVRSNPTATYSGNGSKHFWKWLKAQRKNPDFDRQALAREFHFPSAARFHRAFYFATELTPREFENKIIREAIDSQEELKNSIAHFTAPNVIPSETPHEANATESDSIIQAEFTTVPPERKRDERNLPASPPVVASAA